MTNKGELRWRVLDGAITAPMLIDFMARLVRSAGGKVFLILDRLRVHQARPVQDWLAGRCSPIEVFYLPAYSPEPDPDEGLNADLKQAVTRKPPARSRQELKRHVTGTCAGSLSCQTASEATSGIQPSATPPDPRPPRPDQ